MSFLMTALAVMVGVCMYEVVTAVLVGLLARRWRPED